MNIYRVYNGRTAAARVHVIVRADDAKEAREIAREEFGPTGYRKLEPELVLGEGEECSETFEG